MEKNLRNLANDETLFKWQNDVVGKSVFYKNRLFSIKARNGNLTMLLLWYDDDLDNNNDDI